MTAVAHARDMTLGLGDFSRLLALSESHEPPLTYHDTGAFSAPTTPSDKDVLPGLGNFSNVWSFLGTPPPPLPQAKPTRPPLQSNPQPVQDSAQIVKKAKEQTKPTKKAVTSEAAALVKEPEKLSKKEKSVSIPKSPSKPLAAPTQANASALLGGKSDDEGYLAKRAPQTHSKKDAILSTSTPSTKFKSNFVPSSIPPLDGGGKSLAAANPPTQSWQHQVPRSIEPKVPRSVEDKDWDLLMRIMRNFPEDRKSLVAPMNLTMHNNNPSGIHVFVDASNIFIGFMNEMKFARGIPEHVRVPRADLSFDSLALLMERRRPVAKRVLVGSNPHIPAFDKAKAVGYQCSILEKVEKARQYTDRQIFFMEQEEQRKAKASPHHPRPYANYQPANTSGSDTASKRLYAPIKKVEQGVDEIIHLKICESVLDSPGAPGTIVLATGDAAEAEYSDGFLKTLERALNHGWKVELLSWRRSISTLYTRRDWTKKWGGQFRIIHLDEYAEELLEAPAAA